jgi:hypothetical protein
LFIVTVSFKIGSWCGERNEVTGLRRSRLPSFAGEILLDQKKKKILGVPVGSTMDEAAEIFAAIVRSAPYGRYTARDAASVNLCGVRRLFKE